MGTLTMQDGTRIAYNDWGTSAMAGRSPPTPGRRR